MSLEDIGCAPLTRHAGTFHAWEEPTWEPLHRFVWSLGTQCQLLHGSRVCSAEPLQVNKPGRSIGQTIKSVHKFPCMGQGMQPWELDQLGHFCV